MAALTPILIGTVHDAGLPVTGGALVTYHGSIRWRHGDLHYIADVNGEKCLIRDRDYPSVDPLWVRRGPIRPTGRTVDMCGCGHEAGNLGRHNSTKCEVIECGCLDHDTIRTR